MAQELAFKATLDLDVSNSLKQLTGELPKIGRALEKEVQSDEEKKLKQRLKSLKSQWSGLAREYISGIFNPLVTSQEQRAMMAPNIARTAASGFSLAWQAKAPELARTLGATMESAARGVYMKSNFVYTGARQEVSSYAASMAELGLMPSKESLKETYLQAQARKERAWKAMTEVTKIAQEASGASLEKELAEAGKVMDSVKDKLIAQVEQLVPELSELKDSIDKAHDTLKDVGRWLNQNIFHFGH